MLAHTTAPPHPRRPELLLVGLGQHGPMPLTERGLWMKVMGFTPIRMAMVHGIDKLHHGLELSIQWAATETLLGNLPAGAVLALARRPLGPGQRAPGDAARRPARTSHLDLNVSFVTRCVERDDGPLPELVTYVHHHWGSVYHVLIFLRGKAPGALVMWPSHRHNQPDQRDGHEGETDDAQIGQCPAGIGADEIPHHKYPNNRATVMAA